MSRQQLVLIGTTARVSISSRGLRQVSTIGGAGYNAAIGAIAAGGQPTLITVVGEDLSLDEYAAVQTATVNPFLLRAPGKTCNFLFTYDSDEHPPVVVSEYGNAGLLNEHVNTFSLSCEWVHIFCRRPLNSGQLLRCVRRWQPRHISVDFMLSSLTEQMREIENDLNYVDYIFMNESEFGMAAGWLEPGAFRGRVVVTRGARGGMVLDHGRVIAEVPARMVNIVDATGAGDSFVGAFLARVVAGDTLSVALTAAVAVGTTTTQGVGMAAHFGLGQMRNAK